MNQQDYLAQIKTSGNSDLSHAGRYRQGQVRHPNDTQKTDSSILIDEESFGSHVVDESNLKHSVKSMTAIPEYDEYSIEEISKEFKVLRLLEYRAYLLEMKAINNERKKKRKKNEEFIADEVPLSSPEFSKSGYFLNSENYTHRFKLRVFFHYLSAHLMFYFFGPLAYPIMFPLFGVNDMKNLQFYGLRPEFPLQLVQWMGFALPMTLYIYDPDCGIYPTEIQALMINIFFRCFIIAVRYAYISDTRLFVQSRHAMTFDEIRKDFALYGWRNLSDKEIEMELEVSLIRLKIDQKYFQFSFGAEEIDQGFLSLLEADHEQREEIIAEFKREGTLDWNPLKRQGSEWTKSLVEMINEKKEQESRHKKRTTTKKTMNTLKKVKTTGRVKGKHLARELMITSRKNQPVGQVFNIYMFFILLIPTFFRLYHGIPPFGTGYQIPAFIFLLISTKVYNFQNLLFINLAYVDSGRRLFFMKALSSMISVHKDFSFPFRHKAPLIDLFDIHSLHAWYLLRKVVMDVGKRYADKIYIYFSVVLLGYSVLAAWFVLLILGLIHIDSLDVNLQAILVGNLLMLVFFYITGVLIRGATINEHFTIHRDLLTKNLTHYGNAGDYQQYLDKDLHYVNPMLSHAAEKQQNLGQERFENLITCLQETTKSLYTKLENDENKEPYKILGLKVTWILIGRASTLLLSLFGLIFQYYTNAFKISGSNIE